jgi:UDP-glucose 4-epimerase
MRRVLVTGAAGFIGAALCRRLQERGAEVHGISRRPRDGDAIRWWTADLADPEAAGRIMRRVQPDQIFHLASHVSGNRSLEAVTQTVRNNLLTTVNLLTAACETTGARVILAGSMEESDPGEHDPVPGSPYAAAKTAGTAYARMFHALYGLSVVSLRVFMVYGPGQWDRAKLIPYVTHCLLRGDSPRLSSGDRQVDWVYVDDVVDAFVTAAEAERVDGLVIDVGSGKLVTTRSVVDQLVALVNAEAQPEFGALPDRPMERLRTADVARTRDLMGWEPRTPLDAGLAKTVRWCRATAGSVTETRT